MNTSPATATLEPRRWLAYLGAVSFGLAAPVYSFVVGSKSTFEFDHLEAAVLVLILQVVVTAMLLLGRRLVGRFGRAFDWLVYGGAILVFVRQVQMVVARPSTSFGVRMATLAVSGAAIVITLAARRYVSVFMSYVGPLSVILAGYFLWAAPVTAAGAPGRGGPQRSARPANTVYVLVFDEVSLEALLDGNGRIDRASYPAFWRLSQESVWFRQAIANYPKTADSIPSALIGSYLPKPGAPDVTSLGRPTLLDVLADNGYDVTFYSRALGCASERFRCLGYYSGSVLEKVRRTLASAVNYYVPGTVLYAVAPRVGIFADSTEGQMLADAATGPLAAPGAASVIHLLFTHNPYSVRADGRPIAAGDFRHAEFREGENALETLALYRGQIRYADRQLGIFLNRLRQSPAWDRAVVVVTADHGACWNPGCRQRYRPFKAVEPSLARVPMMIRSPRLAPRVLDVDYQHVDFLPTVLDALGLRTPEGSTIDGRSALGLQWPRPRLFFVSDDRQYVALDLPPRRVEVKR